MTFYEHWIREKKNANCDIMFIQLGDFYYAHYSDAKRVYKDFDFARSKRLEGKIFSVEIYGDKIYSVKDYYKSIGLTVKILSEGK